MNYKNKLYEKPTTISEEVKFIQNQLKYFKSTQNQNQQIIVNCSIRNLKNQSALHKLNATDICSRLQLDLDGNFRTQIQVLKIEFKNNCDEVLENEPEFNNIMDCDFLNEALQLTWLQKFNRFSKELMIKSILTQIYQAIDQFWFTQVIEIQNILENDQDLNLESDTIASATLTFKLLYLPRLVNYRFDIKNSALYLNFISSKINKQENDLLLYEYNTKINKTLLIPSDFSFGFLHENSQTFQENLQLDVQKQVINYTFSSYFKLNQLAKTLATSHLTELYYDELNPRYSKYFEIVMHLGDKILLRIRVNLTYCQFAYLESNQKEEIIYLKMMSPPAFQIYVVKKRKHEIYHLKKDWVRIQNIFLHEGVQHKKITDLQRLMLINNTTIKLVFHDYLRSGKLQGLLKNLTSFSLIHNNNGNDFLINVKEGSNNHFAQYSLIEDKMKCLPHSCQYNIYSIVSTNRLFIPEHLFKLVEMLIEKYYEINDNNFEQIQEATFQQFYKQSENCNLSHYLLLLHDYHIDMFNKIWNNIAEEVFEGQVNKDIVYIYRLNLTPSGFTYQFKMPEETNKVLRDYYDHRECFIRLQIENENSEPLQNTPFLNKNYFYDELKNGVQIFNRKYSLLTWSASQLRSGSCWLFDSQTSNISRLQIIESIGYFQDKLYLNQVAKNAARLGLPFSASSPFQFKSPINVEIIEDKFDPSGKAYTDGIGCISEDLIQEIRKYHNLPFESAVQVRYHGAKGVLALNKKLPQRTIYLRKSMIKFDPPLQQKGNYGNELQIIEYNKFSRGYLNRQLIILLSTLGIPDQAFIDLQNEYLQTIVASNSSIYQLLDVDFQSSIQDIVEIQRKMINAGLNDQNNLFLKHSYDRLKERGAQQLRTKCNIQVEKAARLLGVIDEYGLLQENEVYSIYSPQPNEKPQVVTSETGYVIVSRNPCLHPGDIRKLAIVSDEEIKRRNNGVNPYFPDMVNCVIFPTKGLAITAQCGGGDLDGDQYFISWDDRLMIQKNCEPMVYDEDNKKKKQKLVEERTQKTEQYFDSDLMLDFLLQYLDSDVLGKIDNSHLAIADKSPLKANDERCKRLAILHARAVDYVKHGARVFVPKLLMAKEWPDFMEKENKLFQYKSYNILGKLYDAVKEFANQLTQSESTFIKGYNNSCLLAIDKRFIYKYNQISQKYQNESSFRPFIVEEDRSQIPEDSESAFQDDVLEYEEEILSFIEVTFPDYMIKLAFQCLILIFQQIDTIKRMYGLQSEYEIYTGYYTNFTKGEGTRQKQKLNIENIQVLQHLIKLKWRIDQYIGFCKSQRLAIISVMHFILQYSPSSHLMNTSNFEGQFIYFFVKQIEQQEQEQFLRLQHNYTTWYRGCTWFLFTDELISIMDDNNGEQDIYEI